MLRPKNVKKTATDPPPQRLSNPEEIHGRKSDKTRHQDGFLEKDFKTSALILDDVDATLDEITPFTQ